jgi:hypothetical protein
MVSVGVLVEVCVGVFVLVLVGVKVADGKGMPVNLISSMYIVFEPGLSHWNTTLFIL